MRWDQWRDTVRVKQNEGNGTDDKDSKKPYSRSLIQGGMMIKKWFGRQTARNYFLMGERRVAEGQYEESIELLNKAIELDTNYLDAYLRRGSIYVEMGDVENGISDLSHVVTKKPDFPAARYYRAKAYLFSEKPEQALADVNHAIQFDLNEPANYLLRCSIYSLMEKYSLAVEDATKAIDLGYVEEGYNNRAVIYTKSGNYPAAIADWTQVIEINSNNAVAYCRRGILYTKINEADSGLRDLVQGLKNASQLPDALRQESEDLLARLQSAK